MLEGGGGSLYIFVYVDRSLAFISRLFHSPLSSDTLLWAFCKILREFKFKVQIYLPAQNVRKQKKKKTNNITKKSTIQTRSASQDSKAEKLL